MKADIYGLDVVVADPCRCGSPLIRVCPHSTRSKIPIWRCVWCQRRRGHPTATEIALLESWLRNYGFSFDPLRFPDTGGVEIAYHVPKMWEPKYKDAWVRTGVRPLPDVDATVGDGGRVSDRGRKTVAKG